MTKSVGKKYTKFFPVLSSRTSARLLSLEISNIFRSHLYFLCSPILFLSTKFHFPSFQINLLRPTAQISWKRNKIPFSPFFEMSYITIKRDLFFQSKFKLLPVLILVSLNHESCKFFTHEIYFYAFALISFHPT